jgi:ADP-ribose pyrophosphatase YjhB (NUDIX family)
MKFCSQCGAAVVVRIPQGEDRTRYVCDSCGTIHYQNPKLVVGCVPELPDGRLLICKRAIEPRVGFWTIPAGFMENGETLQQAAARESLEEACAEVEIGSLLTVVHITPAQQVHVFFRARLLSEQVSAGPESLDVRIIHPDEIPWEDIAFPSTEFTLQRYLEDRREGIERHHFTELSRRFR